MFASCTQNAVPELDKQVPEKLLPPTELAIDQSTVTSTSFSVSWQGLESDDVAAYELEYKRADEENFTTKSVYANNCKVTGLEHSTLYVVRLRALSSHGEQYHSDYTDSVEQETLIVYVVTPPQNITVVEEQTTSTSLLVEWDAVENAIGYVVNCTSSVDQSVISESTTETSIVIRGLVADTSYDVKVKTLSRSGEEYDSAFSPSFTAKTKGRFGGIFNPSDFVALVEGLEQEYLETGEASGLDWADENGVIQIKADLDFAGVEMKPITTFSGILEGNGFTISNLTISSYEANSGLFATLVNATVRNLNFASSCSISSSYLSGASTAGTLVAEIKGSCTLENIHTAATVSGATQMGGIAGTAIEKTGDVLFSNCSNSGTITFPQVQALADVKVGGICGYNEEKVSYENCKNTGALSVLSLGGNKFLQLGGIVGGASDANMTKCTNEGPLKIDCRAMSNIYYGGIVGRTFRGNAEECVNTGSMTLTDSSEGARVYMAGCFGSLEGNGRTANGAPMHNYSGCSNSAYIKSACVTVNDVLLGGIIGLLYLSDVDINNCSNSGAIELTTTISNSGAGGIVGTAAKKSDAVYNNRSILQNCTNTGAVSFTETRSNSAWQHIAGICGRTAHNDILIQNCTNRGNVTINQTTRANAGGIVSESKCDVKGCTNYGTIYATDSHVDYYSALGGIVARMNDAKTVSDCTNHGTIIYNGKGFTKANANKGIVGQGGVIGIQYLGFVENCANYGTVLGNEYDASLGKASYINAKGSITGWGGNTAAVTITNCTVGGAIGECVDTDGDMGVSKATAITADNYQNFIYGGDAGKGVTASGCTFGQQ